MKALVAMSGGVDSSVAALFMKNLGYEVIGCRMELCGSPVSAENDDAARVAEALGISYRVLDLRDAFHEKVVLPFVRAYEEGRTPNPCIECNRHFKFGTLLTEAEKLGCEVLATGHYARVECADGKYFLKTALDDTKDQSYVLYGLSQDQLRRVRFPLGALTKAEIRALAEAQGFVNADRPDSQDICFVPDGDYAGVIRAETKTAYPEGDFVDENGRVLGRHKGIIHYTVGQRRGLGISDSDRLYVLAIDPERNQVVLGRNSALFAREAFVRDFHWISGEAPEKPLFSSAKVRYKHRAEPATVYPEENGLVRVVFDAPVRAFTPGQSLVLYNGDTVLGGGVLVNHSSRQSL